VAAKLSNTWKLDGFRKKKPNSTYEAFMNGVYDVVDSIRRNSVGLEDDKEEEDEVLDKYHASTDQATLVDSLEVTNRLEAVLEGKTTSTVVESSEDEEDLIDRQLEAECPNLYANHRQTVEKDDLKDIWVESGNVWEAGSREESPCPTRGSSLDTFATELFRIAEECTPAPQTAYVGEWKGSPWRSVTPYGLPSALRTEAKTEEKTLVVIDMSGDTEGESSDEARSAGG
jgi:hypothetical protein